MQRKKRNSLLPSLIKILEYVFPPPPSPFVDLKIKDEGGDDVGGTDEIVDETGFEYRETRFTNYGRRSFSRCDVCFHRGRSESRLLDHC